MGKASRRKGPVRAKARRSNMGFTIVVVVIIVLGVAGIALSKNSGAGGSSEAKGPPPHANVDHWHATLGVNLCGTWQPNLPLYEPTPNTGIHSHGDAFMHIHPYSASGAGNNANLALFYRQAGDKVAADSLKMAGKTYKNGDACSNLDNKPGEVRWAVGTRGPDGAAQALKEMTGDPARYVPQDGEIVAIAFLPKGTDIGTPPAATSGAAPNDLGAPAQG